MLGATIAALIWANAPWHSSYETLRTTLVGPDVLHLRLSLAVWAGDGLLALFFFVAGLEVKEELTHGELQNLRDAALPVTAAIGGVITPALLYIAVSWNAPDAGEGWAIPTATDIAFALAVLAIVASAMPESLRTFLLTLAVVDDLDRDRHHRHLLQSRVPSLALLRRGRLPCCLLAASARRLPGGLALYPARGRHLGARARCGYPRHGRRGRAWPADERGFSRR
jgi:hypothetical protein